MNISLTCLLSKAVFAHQAIRAKHNYVCVRLFWTIIETPDMSDNHDDVNDASDVTNVQTFLCTDLTLSCLVTSSRRQILGCFWRTLMYSLHLQVQSVGTIVPPPPPPHLIPIILLHFKQSRTDAFKFIWSSNVC